MGAGREKIPLPKDDIVSMYFSENLTTEEISNEFDVCPKTIRNRLKEWGYELKSKKDYARNDGKRKCYMCEKVKDIDKFVKDKNSYLNKDHKCKLCNRLNRYNLTEEEYLNMLEKQNYKCDICGEDYKNKYKKLNIDHDYETGEVRGLICTPCNVGLGQFNDRVDLLKEAVKYLNN